MKLKIGFLLLLCPFFWGFGQEIKLKPGDRVPGVLIRNVYNLRVGGKAVRELGELRLSDFRGKLLILDFWGTFCGPCVQLLPRYDSLQRELGDKLQFLLVSQERGDRVAAFLERSGYVLPSVAADRVLSGMFPHTSIPHEVWIRDGMVMAVTYGEEVNRGAVLRAIGGDVAGVEAKTDDLAFDPLAPLLANGNGRGEVLFQSIITPYNPALNSAEGFRVTPLRLIAVALNHSALALYRQAFAHGDPFLDLDNRTVLELPDSLRGRVVEAEGAGYHAWIRKFGFCYSLVLPPGFKGDVVGVMAGDLNRFFGCRLGVVARLEQRMVDCLVLARVPGGASVASIGGTPVFAVQQGLCIKNLPIGSLDMELARRYRKLPAPFVDETGYGAVDVTLRCDLSDLEALKAELLKSGLLLCMKKRAVAMLVIRQLGPGQF